jgi:DNA-binding MarR family transcriptional regulator
VDRPSLELDDRGDPVTLPFDPIAEAARNWRAHGWAEADVMAAVTSVVRAHQILLARINAVLKPFELTFARYEALVLLTFARQGALPLGRMGERLQVHPASITNAIDRLEAAGYVVREPHPTDGRTTLARITDAGRDVVERATAALAEVRFGAAGLDDPAARRLTDTLEPLRRAAGDWTDE